MRPSPLRHPLAVLRVILKMSQAELGRLCGCSTSTIQAVELGRLELSESLAVRIADATGVNVMWLLDADPHATPWPASPEENSLPTASYTYETFEAHRAALEYAVSEDSIKKNLSVRRPLTGASHYSRIAKEQDAELLAMVHEVLIETRGHKRGSVLRWKLKNFVTELATDFVFKTKLERGE